MTISGAVYREGVAYTPDGAVYVQHTEGATINDPVITGTSGSGVPFVLASSFAAVSGAADTNENVLATITVPANAMGANGMLRILTLWTVNSTANNKTLRVRFSGAAGTEYQAQVSASQSGFTGMVHIANRGATNSQVGNVKPDAFGGWGNGALVTSSVDTTAATTIVISGQKATAGDTLTLAGYLVELIKP